MTQVDFIELELAKELVQRFEFGFVIADGPESFVSGPVVRYRGIDPLEKIGGSIFE